jgi:hypothetical protein
MAALITPTRLTFQMQSADRSQGFYRRVKKSDHELLANTLFAVLHAPPSAYGINRTTWIMADFRRVLAGKGQPACPQVIRRIIRDAGDTMRKAREVLTSHDPEYPEKLARIQAILSALGPDERFFSIDECGPFAVKLRGGRALTPPGQVRTIPQRQTSRGSPIVTAARELSTNQVTHFYSEKKNTAEMIRLLEVLLKEYAGVARIYFSWDAASWHASKALAERVAEVNSPEYRTVHGTPLVEPVVQPPIFLGDHDGDLGGRLRADGAGEEVVVGLGPVEVAGRPDLAAAPLLPEPAAGMRPDLPRGDDHQEPPEVVAVCQPREPAAGQAGARAVEGAQRRVLLVAGRVVTPTARGPQPRPRQIHHPREIPLPQRLRRRQVAGLHPGDPPRDRAVTVPRHPSTPYVPRPI